MAFEKNLTLVSDELDSVTLRGITESDQENLRQWKNANRFAFFFQGIITKQAQSQWFEKYLEREHDWMFIVLVLGQPIGCMGIRLLGAQADVYNVILGNPSMGKRGRMRGALRLMCSYMIARFKCEIGVQVLRSNPALGWYTKLGFRERAANASYVDLELDPTLFRPCSFEERI